MLWFRKRPEAALPAVTDQIAPAELPVALDRGLFKQHFAKLLENAAQDGGIEGYLAALGAKQHAYAALIERSGGGLTLDDFESLLDLVFTARRRVFPALGALGAAQVTARVSELLWGNAPLAQRMQGFVDAMPGAAGMDRDSIRAAAKVRRAAWDFAAELVHFGDPEKYPLMSRWVWDQGTQSGALREFIRGSDGAMEIPVANSPESFEGARKWLAERIARRGHLPRRAFLDRSGAGPGLHHLFPLGHRRRPGRRFRPRHAGARAGEKTARHRPAARGWPPPREEDGLIDRIIGILLCLYMKNR